ncbi:MAG: hypothetical protein WBH47_03655 [Streptosporangiaceae bacterium]
MSNMGLEAPDADSAEQKQDAVAGPAEDDKTAGLAESPLEANEADAAEQDQILDTDDEEYR